MLLDWTDAAHWNGGKAEPCRWCGHGCWTLDDAGRPAHKSCVENLLAPDVVADEVEPVVPFDLAGIVASLGGKCPVCSRFVCCCQAECVDCEAEP